MTMATSPLRDFMSMRDCARSILEDRWISPEAAHLGRQRDEYLPLAVYETADDIVVRAIARGSIPKVSS